jgi:metal-dependent amidase/aminoacylase/carboxypeptidase family protein
MSRLAHIATALLLCAPPAVAQTNGAPALYARMAKAVAAQESALIALRHDIHRHPETSRNEARTAGVIAERLEALGFEVLTAVGGHGVVGVLRGARPGPIVAFRADMDAVRSSAPDPVPYRSLTPGVRHICGHDVHVTVGLGIAEAFAAVRNDLAGSIMLIFQPAEESATGAKAMLADGVFDSTRPDAIYAVHTAPYPVGTLGTAPGGMMAGRARVTVTLTGSGDLAAAADSVRALIRSVNTVPPKEVGQAAPDGFILVQLFPGSGRSAGGTTRTVGAIITTASAEARNRARVTIVHGVERLRLPDVSASTSYQDREIAGVTNDTMLVSHANASIRRVMGDDAVVLVQGVPPVFSEDFGSFQEQVPGVMYFLGVSNPAAGTVGMPHSDSYVADDAAILVGVGAMVAVMLERMTTR